MSKFSRRSRPSYTFPSKQYRRQWENVFGSNGQMIREWIENDELAHAWCGIKKMASEEAWPTTGQIKDFLDIEWFQLLMKLFVKSCLDFTAIDLKKFDSMKFQYCQRPMYPFRRLEDIVLFSYQKNQKTDLSKKVEADDCFCLLVQIDGRDIWIRQMEYPSDHQEFIEIRLISPARLFRL